LPRGELADTALGNPGLNLGSWTFPDPVSQFVY